MSGRLIIIGDGATARAAASIARRSRDPATVTVEALAPEAIATSTLDYLRAVDPATSEVFAAIGVSALNYARFDLWARLRLLGYRCATLIDPSAAIDPSAKLADNVMIGAYAVIGADVDLRSGTIVNSNACIQVGATVDRFAWIGAGVLVGADARVGAHQVLGPGVIVADGAEVAGHGEISLPGLIRGKVAFGSFITDQFQKAVRLCRVGK